MSERLKVLIIDDDRTWQAFLSAALQEGYEVKVAASGDEGEVLAREWQPDTILLDIEMSIRNGYEVCKSLKNTPAVKNIPIIFLSGKSSLQEKIAGFELGADDYLVKPCEAEYLQAKVKRSALLYREKRELDAKATGAQALAFEAMNSSADLGRTLRFAERTYAMTSFDKLAEGLFQTMNEFGLDTSVMFMSEKGPLFYANNKHELSPLEQDMFLAVQHEGRLCDFGRRTFCNFKLVSLLIKNMPVDDPERYGRIKDSVPLILGPAEGKVSALNLQNSLVAHHQQITKTFELLNSGMTDIARQFGSANEVIANHTEALFRAVSSTPVNLDAVVISYQQIRDQLATNNQLGVQLADLLKSIARLAEDHERVRQDLFNNAQTETIELGADEIFSSGVDFF